MFLVSSGVEAWAAPLEGVALAQASSPGSRDEANPGGDKEPWEERLERSERGRLISVAVILGIILVILVLWWGWGKLYHRPRKL